jgi:hypothetical protein
MRPKKRNPIEIKKQREIVYLRAALTRILSRIEKIEKLFKR